MTSFGRYYEDFKVGDTYDHYPAKTITESDNNLFCLLTRNAHPLHSDVTYTANTRFKKPVVVGTYLIALAVGMSVPDVSGLAIANLGYGKVVHHAPVFIGDTVWAWSRVKVMRLSKKSDYGIVTVGTALVNQKTTKVLSFERTILAPRRPDA